MGRHNSETRQSRLAALAFAIILAIAWILGFGVFHVASAAIHVLILLAIVSVVFHFARGQKRTT